MKLHQWLTKWKKNNVKIYGPFYKIKYSLFSFMGSIFSSIRYKNVYFFDTNIIINTESNIDLRHKDLSSVHKVFITESVEEEVEKQSKSESFTKLYHGKTETISFDTLYEELPICCTYYNFIRSMQNPANIASPDFLLQLIFSKIAKRQKLSETEEKIHIGLMGRLTNRFVSETKNNRREDLLDVINEAHIKSIKKRKGELKGKNKNYLNDLRSLATVFVYSLTNKNNVTFVSSDSDAIVYFFDWVGTLIQQSSFHTFSLEILNKYEREGMKRVLSNKKEAIFYDPDTMVKYIRGTEVRFFSNNKKYFSTKLTIKYWDKKREKYFDFSINIDRYVREVFLSLHGPYNCPTVRNDRMGNFIGYRYWWPPSSKHNMGVLKILPMLKPINRVNRKLPKIIHDSICKYRKIDLSNDFRSFSSFGSVRID